MFSLSQSGACSEDEGWNTVHQWSHARDMLSACEKPPRKQDKSCDLSFFKTAELFYECSFGPLPGVAMEVSLLQIIHDNWLLVCVYMPPGNNMF